jgi:hypothetical protein
MIAEGMALVNTVQGESIYFHYEQQSRPKGKKPCRHGPSQTAQK